MDILQAHEEPCCCTDRACPRCGIAGASLSAPNGRTTLVRCDDPALAAVPVRWRETPMRSWIGRCTAGVTLDDCMLHHALYPRGTLVLRTDEHVWWFVTIEAMIKPR